MAGAFAGLRVVEVGEGKAVAYAGKLLRDLGAEVIKIEGSSGDALRAYGPFPNDIPRPEQSGLFLYLNGGKRGARLDLACAEDRAQLDALLEGADVLLHSLPRVAAERVGLAPEVLLERYPRLIVTAITPFGWTGPYAGWHGYAIQAQAASGVAIRTGDPAREPLTAPLDQAEIQHAGVQAAAATALALVHRNRIGRGQFVDISVMEAALAASGYTFGAVLYLGTPPLMGRFGAQLGHSPWGIFPTKDGHFCAYTDQEPQWNRFLAAIGEPEWAANGAFRHPPGYSLTAEQVAEWRGHLLDWFGRHTNAEIWEITKRARIAFQPVHTIGQTVASAHFQERGSFVPQPGGEPPLRVPGPPYRLALTPWLPPGPAPRLDAPPATSWSAAPAAGLDPARPPDGDARLPLAGIRVIDLSQVWAGPLLGCYLADYGADVIVVETGGRATHTFGIEGAAPDSPARWESIRRNRRCMFLNLRTPDGATLFKRLLATADVLLDNFSPHVLPNLGLPYEALAAENPRLIIAALSGLGRFGAWADLLTYGPTLAALVGMKSLTGYPSGELVETTAELDPISAGYGMLAVMAALNHRDRTGRGQMIEIAQAEAAVCGLAEAVIDYQWNGREPGPQANRHRVLAPHGMYPCSGPDRWIAIACGSEEEWYALARSAGHPEWLEPTAFRTAADRRAHAAELDAVIGAWTRDHEAEALTRRLQGAGVAALPAMTPPDIFADPHLSERRTHFRTAGRLAAEQLYNNNPWHLSIASPLLRRPAPDPGADSDEVLRDVLGLTAAAIAAYHASGVIG